MEHTLSITDDLLSGEFVLFRYNEKVTYLNYSNNQSLNNILNLLFVSGYLTLSGEISTSTLKEGVLPNEEVKWLFNYIINDFLIYESDIATTTINDFTNAIIEHDREKTENVLNKMLPNMSYMDETETFYHGFMLGIFSLFMEKGYSIKSNRESGAGRFDLMIKKNDNTLGMIIELKIAKDDDMEIVAEKALSQIEEKEYYEILVSDKVPTIYKYAIIFKGKKCIVR